MADVPRDPRQLARDILSGKVKIEDLARERQLRGGGGPMPARPPVPDRVPLPRSAPPVQQRPVPPQMPRPVQRQPMPARPQQRPIPQQRASTAARVPQGPVARPVTAVPAQRRIEPPAQVPGQQAYGTAGAVDTPAEAARRLPAILSLVRSKRGLRQGILLAEVLGKPVGMRDLP